MTSELKPCPKCLSDRVTCWNVTGGNQIVCKDCGLRNKPHPFENVVRDDWNTRSVPDVPELETVARQYRWGGESKWRPFPPIFADEPRETRELIVRDQAAEILAAKDKEIERLRKKLRQEFELGLTTLERAEAAEAKLAQMEKQS